jgi:hypothetical protein
MSKGIPPDNEHLIAASKRLRRILLAWAALFAALGLLTLLALRGNLPIAALPWLAGALALAVSSQPVMLAYVAVTLGISLVALIPTINQTFAVDPVALLFGIGTIEIIALAVIRLILLIMAWNQFLFYRMLYGTEGASGLDPDWKTIPEVIPNRTDQLAVLARWFALAAIVFALLSFPLDNLGLARVPLVIAFGLVALAVGIGVGVAFSPTQKRRIALTAVGLGVLAFMMLLSISRVLLI